MITTIVGTSGNDTISGTSGNDQLFGAAGLSLVNNFSESDGVHAYAPSNAII